MPAVLDTEPGSYRESCWRSVWVMGLDGNEGAWGRGCFSVLIMYSRRSACAAKPMNPWLSVRSGWESRKQARFRDGSVWRWTHVQGEKNTWRPQASHPGSFSPDIETPLGVAPQRCSP